MINRREVLVALTSIAGAHFRTGQDLRAAERVIRPEMFGALGKGDDTRALQAFLNGLGDGVDGVISLDHEISSELSVRSRSRFRLSGSGSIKIADGTKVATGYGGILFNGCADFELADFTIDGNRDNREPAETATHLFNFQSCSHFEVRRCRAVNGTTDGFYVASSTPALKSTHSHDFQIVDCVADNNFRQGLSIIQAYAFRVQGGRFVNTNGTAPEAGIDLESNRGNPEHSIEDGALVDVLCSENSGYGVMVSGESTPRGILLVRPRLIDNVLGAVTWGASDGEIQEPYISGGNNGVKRGIIDVPGVPLGGHLKIIRPVFRNMTFRAGHSLIYVHSKSGGHVQVDALNVDSCYSVARLNGDFCSLSNFTVGSVIGDLGISSSASAKGVKVKGGSITKFVGTAILMQGRDAEVSDVLLVNPVSNHSGGCIRIMAAGAKVEGNVIRRVPPGPGYGIRLDAPFRSLSHNIIDGFTSNPLYITGDAARHAAPLKAGNVINGLQID